ncbi:MULTISPECIES: uracil-xanthine permease family protein [unclassified Gemella]|uniref:uracil-xanthine permease family protein n=1 Tax=unclassified Gemella TaxID=2624949 RepID=UPI001C04D139|nr:MULTISPECIES: nucleobase:cation symporter-2 family protein [unclassified Gemella]MBU0278670.1 purine permease [Gemella sp. zg-1178]QWQ39225.1 purine permease [Gemella sp. zg-570]
MSNSELFKLDGNPSFSKSLPISIQHVLAMIIGNIAPAIIIAQSIGLKPAQITEMVQSSMICAGLATILQIYGIWKFGARLPIVMGTNFAFVPVIITINSNYGFSSVFGACLVGSIFLVFFGLFIEKIIKYFPPIVTGTTVLSMGISLYPVAISYMAGVSNTQEYGNLTNWAVAIITLVVVLAIDHFGKGYIKILSILIGIVVGYLLSFAFGLVDFSAVSSAPYLSYPKVLPLGIEFHTGAIITMIVMYLVTSIQVIGDVSSLTVGAINREASKNEVSGALMSKELSGFLTAILGGLPSSSFAQNIGIISITKVVSKKVVTIAGIIILALGFFPKFSSIMTTIPYPVLGGATLSVFSIITINGIKLISREKMKNRNAGILGISLAFGLGLTTVPATLAKTPLAF